jgi:hypothetical protein
MPPDILSHFRFRHAGFRQSHFATIFDAISRHFSFVFISTLSYAIAASFADAAFASFDARR